MLIKFKQLDVQPGQRILLKDVSWQQFEGILEELGEKRAARIAYDKGILEIMSPLPEHEINKVFLINFV